MMYPLELKSVLSYDLVNIKSHRKRKARTSNGTRMEKTVCEIASVLVETRG